MLSVTAPTGKYVVKGHGKQKCGKMVLGMGESFRVKAVWQNDVGNLYGKVVWGICVALQKSGTGRP